MNCPNCDTDNVKSAVFCHQCAMVLTTLRHGNQYTFNVFIIYLGMYVPLYDFQLTAQGAIDQQNASTALEAKDAKVARYLGRVQEISEVAIAGNREWQVLQWWELELNDHQWQIGNELAVHPRAISLAPL